jgi:iron(III) transport system permease protein
MKNSKSKKISVLLPIAVLLGIIVYNLVLPMMSLLFKAVDYDPPYEGFVKEITSERTREAIFNSIWVSSVAAMAAVVLAFYFAYIVQFKLRGKTQNFFRFFAIMPMLLPSITYGIVLIYLFGKSGIFTQLSGIQLPIYGPLGIIMGSFFYAFPIAFLLLSQAFANIDNRYLEAAKTIGASSFARFKDIVLPVTKYAVFSAFAVCFTVILTDYGISVSVGGRFTTLSLLFYRRVIGLADFSQGAIFSTFILIPAITIFLLDIFYFSKKQLHSGQNKRPVPKSRLRIAQFAGFFAVILLILIPLIVVCIAPFVKGWPYNPVFTFEHIDRILSKGRLVQLIRQSVSIALVSGLIGTVIAFVAGYMYVRVKSGFGALRKLTHVLYLITLAIPGLAMGLGFLLFFRGTGLQNTAAILVIVNIMHFIGSPYMMVVSHFKLLNPNLEDICRSLGGKWYHNIKDVILPNSKRVLLDSFVYLFTNSMITISAVSMLVSARTGLLSLQITAYNNQGDWESAIAVSLIIFVINAAVKLWQTMSRVSR